MASFKLKFRPSTAEGKLGTLYFQVTHRRSTRAVYTDYRVMPEEWDGRTSFIRIVGTPERQAELQLIVSKIRWDCKRLAAFITEREPAMQDIVDNYAHLTKDSPYLLPIITKADGTERRQYERMEHKVNYYLKKIGAMAGLRTSLTTYTGRHTWASAMRDMGTSLSVISKGLGHENLKTTQIYLSSIDTEDVVKANRKMIGKIMRE